MKSLYQALGIAALLYLVGNPALAQDQIYAYTSDKGQLFFSDQQAHVGFKEYGAEKRRRPAVLTTTRPSDRYIHPRDIEQTINTVAKSHRIDANLVRAIVKTESNFNHRAVSHKGAMGLMQLMPATARYLRVNDPFDPQQNIGGGVRYFSDLLKQYQGNVKLALAAYNAGPGAVSKYNGVPPYPETVHYIKKVLRYYEQLKSYS